MSIERVLGDYQGFFAALVSKLQAVGIDVSGRPVSHLAYRTATVDEYRRAYEDLRPFCGSDVENTWNGRPIGKLLLKSPLALPGGFRFSLIELIPPPHQRVYPMGLEHAGFVFGDDFDTFSERHREQFTGQQDQGPYCQPWYITFENNFSVKFYRHSLKDVVEMEGRPFTPYAA